MSKGCLLHRWFGQDRRCLCSKTLLLNTSNQLIAARLDWQSVQALPACSVQQVEPGQQTGGQDPALKYTAMLQSHHVFACGCSASTRSLNFSLAFGKRFNYFAARHTQLFQFTWSSCCSTGDTGFHLKSYALGFTVLKILQTIVILLTGVVLKYPSTSLVASFCCSFPIL